MMEPREVSRLRERCQNILEQMLNQVRMQVEEQTRTHFLPERSASGEVDLVSEDYLYQINSFYYRTFHERLFPSYCEEVRRETAEIFRVSRQEAMIWQDIANNLIRYAQLSNRLKEFGQVIAGMTEQVGGILSGLEESRAGVGHDLYYALREVQGQVTVLEGWFGHLEQVLAVTGWWERWQHHHLFRSLLAWWSDAADVNPEARQQDGLNRWLAGLARTVDFMDAIVAGSSHATPATIRDRFKTVISGISVTPDHLPDYLGTLIREGLAPLVKEQVEKVEAYLEIEVLQGVRPGRSLQAIDNLKLQLSGWLSALEEITALGEVPDRRRLMGSARILGGLALDEVQGLGRLLREYLRELGAAMGRVEGRDLNPAELVRLVEEPLARLEKELRIRSAAQDYQELRGLGPVLRETLARMDLFWVKFDYFRDRLDYTLRELEHHRSMVDLLQSYGEVFATIKSDTDELLNPRHLQRFWRGLPVEVERYPLVRGERFPDQCRHLLEQVRVERRLVPEAQHLTVIEEKGDIFHVLVNAVERWEVPYMVVGIKE